jgi:hypothetical protein
MALVSFRDGLGSAAAELSANWVSCSEFFFLACRDWLPGLMVLSLKKDKCKEDPLLLTDLLSRLLVCLALD